MTSPGFSESLRQASDTDWQAAIHHRFVTELADGRIENAILRRYLVQDYQFIDRFVALLGAAIASAPAFPARLRLSRFLAMITDSENTYFQRSFDRLGVPAAERESPALTPTTTAFQALMAEAAASRSYAEALSVLAVAEGLYLNWAERLGGRRPPDPLHAEWIDLHDNPFFRDFVHWLRGQLDQAGAALDEAGRARCASLFSRAVALERRFFDDLY